MARTGPQDASLLAHVQRAAEGGSAAAVALLGTEPPFPEEGRYLWQWFVELASGVHRGGLGEGGVTYVDVQAWASLMDHHPNPMEVWALLQLDGATRNPQMTEEDPDE